MGSRPPVGVLLVNLGSPDAPTTAAVRRYLREFLSDPRVVDIPRWIWWPLLNGLILPFRARRSAALYRRVWSEAGSPLIAITQRLGDALQQRLGAGSVVRVAMRYGQPALTHELEQLRATACSPLVVVPLFPQFANATVGSIRERVATLLNFGGWSPDIRTVPPYHADGRYLDAAAAAIARERVGHTGHLLFSFHGLPMCQVQRGDPYPRQCEQTAQALARRLGLASSDWTLVYQSRFGPQPWLRPYAVDEVVRLAARHPRLLVACPGFAADCLETLDEVGVLLAATFRRAGGEELRLVPCLNDDAAWIDGLAGIVRDAASLRVDADQKP